MSGTTLDIQDISLGQVQARMAEKWDHRNAAHAVIIGENGSGKSYLETQVILPLCELDRVLFVDVKGDDPVLSSVGQPIDRLTPGLSGSGGGPWGEWYRLVLDPIGDKAAAKRIGREALEIVLDEGHWVVFVDETRAITDREELNLGQALENILMRGRSRAAQVIMAAQATEYMIPSTRNQWAFAFVGSIKDEVVIKRTLQILGLPHSGPGSMVRELLANPKRRWLYADKEAGGALAWVEP